MLSSSPSFASHAVGHCAGGLGSPEHADLIEIARQRSYGYGLAPEAPADYSNLSRKKMTEFQEKNRFLRQHAVPIMENLYEQIANTQSVVLLTAANGTILHTLGDTDFLDKAAKVALIPGVEWSERSKGTNAIGTALALERPVVVHGEQHFLKANQFLTCSCTPIFDPNGILIGALDVSSDHRNFHQHTMALARMSAQMIENRMFSNVFANEMIVHFHARPEFLGTLVEGIAVFSQDGRFLSANRSAQYQYGLSNEVLKQHSFASLFGVSMTQFLARLQQTGERCMTLELHNGVKVFCGCEVRPARTFTGATFTVETESGVTQTMARKGQLSSLKYLDTGDPQVSAVLQKLKIVQGRDIPIMILGETGTGKDLLAQAIHNDSPRARGRFVSVNCASIPESLIESELFGYEEGAFTGAKRKGSVGYIQAADGGTLFLDEIGDMPHHLQARLLRVLQERKVTPLGGGKEVEVDIAVICATNKNLKQMIADGTFREDLYYRLNGLVVRLPALKDRQDFEAVTHKILQSLSQGGASPRIAPEVMQLLRRHRWPGNFRQLFNLLRTTVAMAEGAEEIQRIHLPDDFLEEIQDEASVRVEDAMPAAIPVFMQAVPVPSGDVMTAMPASAASVSATPLAGVADGLNLNDVTLDAIAQALRQARGNVSQAAKALGISRNTIYRKKHQMPSDLWS